MAFPTTSVIDDFNRADGGMGAGWLFDIVNGGAGSSPGVASNQFAGTGTFGRNAWRSGSTFGPDTEVFATVSTKPTNGQGWAQLLARLQSPGTAGVDGYKIELSPAAGTDTVEVYRIINGSDTQLGASISQEFTAGDRIGMEVLGTGATVTINVYRYASGSWSLLGSRTDTDAARIVSAGYIGLGFYQLDGNVARFDDFGGGTVVPGGVAPANTVAPVVSGTTTVGETLSCTTGTWTGDATITYGYQWQEDVAGNGSFSNIVGATSSTYLLDAAQEGDDVRCVVTGTNGAGSDDANSNEVGPIAAADEGSEDVLVRVSGEWVGGNRQVRSGGVWV